MNVPVRAAADLRLLRATVFSAVCVALSAAGHVLASGTWVPLWSLVAGWAAVLGAVGPLAGRERSLPGIALTLLAGELGLHLLFCAGQLSAMPGHSLPALPGHVGGGPNHVVALAERLLCGGQAAHLTESQAARIVQQAHLGPGTGAVSGPGAHMMTMASMFSLPMLAAHLAAAVVTGVLLRRCEIALWRVVRLPALVADQLVRLALLARATGLLTAVRRGSVAALLDRLLRAFAPYRAQDGPSRRARSLVVWSAVARRGPPATAVAA
ncbi:hypothetical protein ACL02U_10885 [Streptomyces sp. MS06]|uniref:hypothetical protein n=1 Tax=Streptomyces sp. MS06 TaxID=3385974 RepID=UPI0039A22D26